MITQADQTLADHEAANTDKKWVVVRAKGWQPGFGSIPGRWLFNVVAGHAELHSTVTIESLLKLGLRVEVVE